MACKFNWRWMGASTLLILVVGVMAAAGPLDAVLKAGAGMAAHNLCSSTFISGLPQQDTLNELVGALIGPGRQWLRVRVDHAAHSAEASLLYAHARAQFTEGYGCRLEHGPVAVPLVPRPAEAPAPIDSFAPAAVVTPAIPALATALDRIFAESPGQLPRRVKAVVIVKDDHVVAERYAPDFSVDTPLMSFSVAKSLTNALLGILVRQGKLSMDQPAPVPEWQRPGDPRASIRPDDLLQMASGLDAPETGSGLDATSQMLYVADDMGAYSANRPLKQSPGKRWEYTSNDTLILDRMLGHIIGGGPAGLRAFAQTELFAPLGMQHVTLEFDGAGTFVGSNHVYASARAFARFGLLYLHDGVAPDGCRILPEGWVAYSRRSTLGSSYGAGFWTNDGSSEYAAERIANGFPKDGFFASGNLGQRIYIVPSERLVIVRFGYSRDPNFGISADLDLIAAAIAALKPATGRP